MLKPSDLIGIFTETENIEVDGTFIAMFQTI